MFKKVLVAEDMDDINKGVITTLKELGIATIDKVQYCDDAYLKINKAIYDKEPYDLLITDLSFIEDYREQKYKSGEELVKVLREKEINIHIIVFSVEDRLQRVRRLINNYAINAYVSKGRNGLRDLNEAINSIYLKKSTLYLSNRVDKAQKKSNDNDISNYDVLLMKKLADGLSQSEISENFIVNDISPSSISSIEKRLNKLKDIFRASNTTQLIALAKDQGFI